MANRYRRLVDLSGKRAVVTGGAGLVGREIARALGEFGAKVIVVDVDEKAAKKIGRFHYFDISDVENISSGVERIESDFGPIDIWVNSAYPRTSDWPNGLEKMSVESWRKNVDMHLNGYCISSNEAAKYMAKRGRGVIINIGSIQALVAPDFNIYKGTKLTTPPAYCAIKGGILMYSKYLASYYGKRNVRVNVVCPGGVSNNQPRAFVKKYSEKTLLGRMAKAEDVASSVAFLASDAASYITGAVLAIDGGLTAI